MRTWRIVITGGPCGGKTAALAYLGGKLEEFGFVVFTVPEAASLCIRSGVNPALPWISSELLQESVFRATAALEAEIHEVAERALGSIVSDKRGVIILHDRGIMDGAAYLSALEFAEILRKNGFSLASARDQRYDAVIHMVTAAHGAEDCYTVENNPARTETLEAARELDARTQSAWAGHPRLRIVDNRSDFTDKLQQGLQEICEVIGFPITVKRK